MTVTLLPITALLLLLSGIGGPVRAAGSQVTVAALGASWLTAPHGVASARTCGLRALGSAGCSGELAASQRTRPLVASAAATRRRSRGKLYTTRFGFAEGAYLALGPPAGSFCADLA